MLYSADLNIYLNKVIPILQDQLRKNNLTCDNCFINTVFGIQKFVKDELINLQWCRLKNDDEKCNSSLKMANLLNQKVFFLLTPSVNELGTFSSFFYDQTTNFEKDLLSRLIGKNSTVDISELVYNLLSDSTENNLTKFEIMDSITSEVLFTIMKESYFPPHIFHFESTNFTNISSISFNLPSKELVGYPMIKITSSIGAFPYIFNREPLIPLCNYKAIDQMTIYPIDNFCKMFRWSLTDLGICYSANGLEDSAKYLKRSAFKESFKKVFGMAEKGKGLYYAEGTGPKKSLRIVLDAHTSSSTYRKIKAKNNFFKVLFHETESFPLVGLEGLKIEAGYRTKVTLKTPNLVATDNIRFQFCQTFTKKQ